MRARLVFPAMVLAVGTAVGVLLWVSGFDAALQDLLWATYDHDFNQVMRAVGELGLGRTLVWGSLAVGLAWAWRLRGKSRENGAAFAGRLVWGIADQLLLWVRGKWRWTGCWRGLARGPRAVLATVCVMAVNGTLQTALKMVVGRARPKEVFWNGVDPYAWHPFSLDAGFWSLPSGHSASAFAVGVWLALCFPRWRWLFVGVAALLSVSRVLAVTTHYLGDVVAGAALGSAVALAMFALMDKAGGLRRG